MKLLLLALLILTTQSLSAQKDSMDASKIPFDGYDLSWINGQNRQQENRLIMKSKSGENLLTGTVLLDTYFNYNFAQPKDNTQTISATTGRSNEFQINQASIGIETNYKNAIGRLWLQTGSMLHIVQETDGAVARGRNTGTGDLKFIREAAAGYHFHVNYGLNIEAGIFMSYIGLESYVLQENWSYQRSMVCDFTPFYFQGVRLQYYPAKNFKTELWIFNGWQTYNSWSRHPGIGNSNYYRPKENIQLAANFYYGIDSKGIANGLSRVYRFHHDHSIVLRYYKAPQAKGISQAAFSLNNHYGFQSGDGLKAKDNYMTGASLANRLWFNKNRLALTLRGDYVTNPGGYLSFYPAAIGHVPNAYDIAIAQGKSLQMTQLTATFDVMPTDITTFRFEYTHRTASIPYFAGPGGTTSQTGFSSDPIASDWQPDLRNSENRLILSVNFRL